VTSKTKLIIDIIERAFFTWAEVFFGLLIAANVVFEDTMPGRAARILSAVQAAGLAAIPAALAVIKGGFASLIGNRDDAAILPADVD
jgi:hypothetical protein